MNAEPVSGTQRGHATLHQRDMSEIARFARRQRGIPEIARYARRQRGGTETGRFAWPQRFSGVTASKKHATTDFD